MQYVDLFSRTPSWKIQQGNRIALCQKVGDIRQYQNLKWDIKANKKETSTCNKQ